MENICTCDVCRHTFDAFITDPKQDGVPFRCPDCGKTAFNGMPAVRKATAAEIKEYHRIQSELKNE